MPSKRKSGTNGPANDKTPAASSAHGALHPDPAHGDATDPTAVTARRVAAQNELAARFTHNRHKDQEYQTRAPAPAGQHETAPQENVLASTVSEAADADPDGGSPPALQRARFADPDGELTTNQGVPVADNQNSLRQGARGPTLLEDFILREKITHFDHERIPERVVHARGSAAHGYFENYAPLHEHTRASLFAQAGKRTPVFVRFSTVAGERGSTDTARDVRGFAVKFYTDEGNWDLVGNNMPVFFIQDALKFPDLIHAVKPEPHNAMPQAASAHDTFWDFVSLMPESTHMLMWVMSDRAIPRSYRMMQGFGVHTFRLIDAQNRSKFVKFHWKPRLGTHSLVWDEAVKISGADPDFHRRDLWEAIETGAYPEWELGLQIFTEEQASRFSFDVLDATKIVPEELVPIEYVGKMVLNRNPDNFFAETEQVAFCTSHVVPGLDFSNDPLLAGRLHSYQDTQISRLGGPNFAQLPINAPAMPVRNNQRDAMHQSLVHRGRVAYEPNSLAGGCPFQAGARGFSSFMATDAGPKVRAKGELFAEHYAQATLFYESQTEFEKRHIAAAFRFELSRVQVPAIRERMLASLRNASEDLARTVAEGLGMALPEPMPRAAKASAAAPSPSSSPSSSPSASSSTSASGARQTREQMPQRSPSLSLTALPGEGGIRTRKIAVLIADGVAAEPLNALVTALTAQGALPILIAPKIGPVRCDDRSQVQAVGSLENSPAVLFDALALPDGAAAVATLAAVGLTTEMIVNQYRHCKAILAIGAGKDLLAAAGNGKLLPEGKKTVPGIVLAAPGQDPAQALDAFVAAVAQHRHPQRETDPPLV